MKALSGNLNLSSPLVPTTGRGEFSGAFVKPRAPGKRLDWKSAAISLVLALGLTVTFVSPMYRFSPSKVPSGIVAGVQDSNPLTVEVLVWQDGTRRAVRVQPVTGTLAQALAMAADQLGGSFSYQTRGTGQYVESFLGVTNGPDGRWRVQQNGLDVEDLSSVTLTQADVISVIWHTSI